MRNVLTLPGNTCAGTNTMNCGYIHGYVHVTPSKGHNQYRNNNSANDLVIYITLIQPCLLNCDCRNTYFNFFLWTSVRTQCLFQIK